MMQACDLISLVVYFNVKPHDIWEGNMTTRDSYKRFKHFLRKVELKLCRVRHDPSMSTTTTHALERILLKDELFNKTWGEFVVATIGPNTPPLGENAFSWF